MATYIKGVKDYVPQLEVFKPDYKFLSDVLTVRQDRYDTNYKSINDLYSKVVYADMSREDNIEQREQYANQLSNGLKQVSGLDLSLQQNVDVAKGLFKPFFENKSLLKDMAFTKQYKKNMQYAQGLMTNPDENMRDRYWQDGITDLQYQMQDFKSGTADQALSQGMPNYVENPNLYERAFEKLKESGLEIEQTTLQGDWIIKTKNGTALTRQLVGYEREQTGTDPNGNPIYGEEYKTDASGNKIPIYKNPAAEFLKETVMKDPLVIAGYRVQAKNRARKFSEDQANIQQYGSVENAKKAWADNILGTQTNKDIEKVAELDTEVKNKETAVFNWEEYKKQHNIIPGTPEEEVYLRNRIELQLAQKTRDLTVERIKNAKAPTSDMDDLLNKAYSQYMASVMGPLLSKAAVAYSQVGASQTFEANPFKKMEHQHKYNLHLKQVQHQYDMNKLHAKAKYDLALAERKAQLDAINAEQNYGGGIGGPGAVDPSNIGSEVTGNDPDANLLEYNEERMKVWAENIEGDKVNWISDMIISLPGSFSGSDWYSNGEITYTDKNGNKVTQDMQTAFMNLRMPENSAEFKRIYQDAVKKFENVTTTENGARVYKDIPSLGIDAETAIRLQTGYNQNYSAETMFIAANEEKNKQYTALMNKVRYDDGDMKEAVDGGAPLIILTEREMAMSKDGIPSSDYDKYRSSDKYAGYADTSPTFLNKEQYNDLYMTAARGDNMVPGGDMLAYLNKNYSDASNYTHFFNMDYDPDEGYSIDVFEQNPLLREHYRWIADDIYFETWPPTGKWIFKAKAANKRANRFYDDDKDIDDQGDGGMYNSINKLLSSSRTGEGDGDLPGFSIDAYMLGQEYFGTGQMAFKQYTSTYDHAIKNQQSLDQLNAIYAGVTGDGFKDVTFSLGDNRSMTIEDLKGTDQDDGTYNPELAKAIWEMAVRETHYKYGKNDDRTKRPVLNTSYVEKVGGPDSEDQHAGYNVTFGPDFATKFKPFFGESESGKTAYESFLKNGITITIPTEYDMNPYKSVNQILSATDMIIAQDNKFESSIVNGGSYSIYKNQNGQYVREMQLYGWNEEAKAIVPDPMYAEPLVIDKSQLDQLVITTDAYLNEIMKSNVASQTKWKNSQK